MIIIAKVEERNTPDGRVGHGSIVRHESDDRVRDDHAVERGQIVLVLVVLAFACGIFAAGGFDGVVDAPFVAVAASEGVEFFGDDVDDFLRALAWFGGRDGEDGDVLVGGELAVALGPFDVGFDFAAHDFFGGVGGDDFVADANAKGEEGSEGFGCCVRNFRLGCWWM